MNKQLALKLKESAEETAKVMSSPYRQFNRNQEKFTVETIVPLSETTAAVVFKKSSGKKALCFFYWLASKNGYWEHFFVRESHLVGMLKLQPILQEIDQNNFPVNFDAWRLSHYA